MPQNGIIGVHGIQNDQKLQKMEHYFKMHHLILCRSEGVKNRLYTFSSCARTHIFYYWSFLNRSAVYEIKISNEAEM